MIRISVSKGGEKKKILFSGDVGRWHRPIVREPTIFDEADYVIVESTYGDRLHEESVGIGDRLAEVVKFNLENWR